MSESVPSESIRVFLLIENRLLREALVRLLRKRPDLTIVLDLSVEVGLQRASWRRGDRAGDRFEAEDRDFHQKLREAYLELAERDPQRCTLIDGSADPASVGNAIWAVVNARLHPAEAPLHLEDVAP